MLGSIVYFPFFQKNQYIEMFISEDCNATKTIKFLQLKYNLNSFGHKSIYDLYSMIRKSIAQNYNDAYKTKLKN